MLGSRLSIKAALATGVVAAALLGGGLAVASTGGGPNRSQGATPHYPVNARGMTYGSALNATSLTNEPNLIEAIGTNGKIGYVRAADLNPPESSGPAQAMAQQQSGESSRVIPLYASDGVTVIGQFVLQAPQQGQVRGH